VERLIPPDGAEAVHVLAPAAPAAEDAGAPCVALVLRAPQQSAPGLAEALRLWAARAPGGLRLIVIGARPALADFAPADAARPFGDGRPVRLYVLQDAPGATDPGLPPDLLLRLADLLVERAENFTLDGETWPYLRTPGDGPRTLFLFPGTIYPVTLGSHRRAVTMLTAMVRQGFDLYILYTGPSLKSRERAAPFLRLFAVGVASYSNRRDPLGELRVWLRRKLHAALCRLAGASASKPQTFTERRRLRNSRSLRAALDRAGLSDYDVAFVNYAWMMEPLRGRRGRARVTVCDTHDVQFYRATRNQDSNPIDRLLFSDARERAAEIAALRRADFVLAISERDAGLLREALPPERVLCAPSPFDYLRRPARRRTAYAPLTFGFIGHDMDANARSLRLVLEQWWPAIRRFSPDSTLRVAGSICNAEVCRRGAFLDVAILTLGFVDDLSGFYGDIDVLLSPVVVAGGLNYKNAEALAAGITLVTNAMGAEALAPLAVRHVAETAEDVVRALREIERDPEADYAARQRAQREVLATFHPYDALAMIADRARRGPARR
jgi:hypothetical protein